MVSRMAGAAKRKCGQTMFAAGEAVTLASTAPGFAAIMKKNAASRKGRAFIAPGV